MSEEEKIDMDIIDDLLEMADEDDPDFFVNHTEKFINYTNELKTKLHVSIEQCDRSEIEVLAHSVTGSAANFGASYLASLCRNLEQNAKTLENSEMKSICSEIDKEYNSFCTFIRQKSKESRS